MDGTFKDGLVACMEKMVRDGKKEDIMTAECQAYQNEEGSFGRDSAKRQRKNKNFDPGKELNIYILEIRCVGCNAN